MVIIIWRGPGRGTESAVESLITGLRRYNVDFMDVSSVADKFFKDQPDKIYRLEKFSPDLIHTHSINFCINALKKPLYVPTVLTVHGYMFRILEPKKRIAGFIRDSFFSADAIIAPSIELKNQIKKEGFDNVFYIPNMIDPNKFTPELAEYTGILEEIRKDLKISEKDTVVASVGNMHWYKGVDTFLEAGKILQKSVDNLKLLWIGKDMGWTRLSKFLEPVKDIFKLVEIRDYNLMPFVYHLIDVYCHFSRWDACSMSFLEAMSSGIPVVHTPVGEHSRVNLCTGRTPEELAELVLKCIDRKSVYGRLFREEVLKRYSIDAVMPRVLRLYMNLIEDPFY